MKKKILLMVLALTAVLVATPYFGMVYATKPMPITFGVPFDTFGGDLPREIRQAGNSYNWIEYANTNGEYIGDIVGTFTAKAHWIYHDWVGPVEDPDMSEVGQNPNGHVVVTIDPESVMGETVTGTLTLKFTSPGNNWVIYGGTGDLEGLHGQGTWGMGMIGMRVCQVFEGQVHFAP